MDLIITNPQWEEKGYLECDSVDIENGDQNDFEIQLRKSEYNAAVHCDGSLIFIPDTEWGGIIKKIHPSGDTLYLGGPTWRGRLEKSIVQPDSGKDYYTVSGDANTVIGAILKRQGLTELFQASSKSSGIQISSYNFPRYYSVYAGLQTMLDKVGAKLKIVYRRGKANGVGHVEVSAVKVTNYSDQIEINNDMEISYNIEVNKFAPNHLICLGHGELKDRTVLHFYADAKGQIVDKQVFTGLNEITEVYELSNEEDEEKLESDAKKKFKELLQDGTTTKATLDTDRINIDIGDIVGGRERITGVSVQSPVVRKILKISNGEMTVEYKLKGE